MKKRDQIYAVLVFALACGVVSFLAISWRASLAHAAAPITPSGLNTQVSGPRPVDGQTQFDITGGTRPGGGPNLFHSFGDFNVPNNHIANFLNDSGLPTSNILGRVNGGNPSNIFGTIQTTGFGHANLFLMNPAGIVFGPTASLNIGGSVTFTTADYLKLADGVRFQAFATPSADALLSAAPVAAFGFLGSHPEAITVQGSQLAVASGKDLSLIGDDIRITGGTLTAPGGQINLVSLAGRGEARIAPEGIAIGGKTARGHIEIKGGSQPEDVVRLDTSGDKGGAVVLRGGRLSLTQVEVTTEAKAADQTGGDIVIEATKSATLDSVGLHTGPTVFSDERITVEGGSVSLTAPSVRASHVTIDTSGDWGGLAGDVAINVRNLTASHLNISTDPSPESTSGRGAGKVDIRATGDLTLRDSFIFTGSGEISVRAARATLTNSLVRSSSEGGGPIGNIVLDVGRLTMRGASIRTDGRDVRGGGGNISLSAREAILIDGSEVSAGGIGRADGGSITVSTPRLTLNHLGRIGTISDGIRAGDISVNVRTLNMFNGGRISTRASFGGSSSNIDIVASRSISMAGVVVDDRGNEIHSGIDSQTDDGRAGSIHLVTPTMTLSDGAVVRATSFSSLDQSPIVLDVARLHLLRGASIESNGYGSASIVINAAKSIALDKGTITTRADEGGNVNLHAGKSIQIRNGSRISAENGAEGDGLHVVIQAGKNVAVRDSTVSAGAQQGNGGTIAVDAKHVTLTNSQLTTSVSGGPQTVGGRISMDAKNLTLRNSHLLSTATEGQGGTIRIRSHVLHRDAKSVIDASSESGTDGTVIIQRR